MTVYVCPTCSMVKDSEGICPHCGVTLKAKHIEDDWHSCCD